MSGTIDIENTEPAQAGSIALEIIDSEVSSSPDTQTPTVEISPAELEKDMLEHEKYLKKNYEETVQELSDQDEALATLLQQADSEELERFIQGGGEVANGYVLSKFVETVKLLGSQSEDDKYTAGYLALESMNIKPDTTDPALHSVYEELQTGQVGMDDAARMLYAIPEIKAYADKLNDPNTTAADMTAAFVDAYKRAYRDYGYLKDDKSRYEATHSL